MVIELFILTRPKPAYGRQGLDWIVGPEYSFRVKNEKPTWNHKKHKNHGFTLRHQHGVPTDLHDKKTLRNQHRVPTDLHD